MASCASLHRPKGRHWPPLQRVGGLVVADVNGDGIADLVAGLPGNSEYRREVPGRVVVWFGGRGGLRSDRAATFREPTIGQGSHLGSFGQAVAAVGDVNRDGFADVVVGAPAAGSCTAPPAAKLPRFSAGRVFLLAGSRDGFAATPLAFVDGTRMGGRFGSAFRGAGDIDGDGAREVVIEADGDGPQICWDLEPGVPSMYPSRLPSEERVFRCRASGLSPWPGDVPRPDESRYVVAGDFDGDGRADLLSTIVVPGVLAPMQALAWGDVDGDGLLDLAAGHSESRRGRLLYYRGVAGRGIREPPTATLLAPVRAPRMKPLPENEDALAQTAFGQAVAVTDVDHDGFADVIVGAPWEDKIYVYAGSRTGPREPARQVLAHEEHTWFPGQMAAGDFDGDGYGDLAVTDMGRDAYDPWIEPSLTVYRGSSAGLIATPAQVIPLVAISAGQ
jgi:hypothetical protein